jgi:glucose-6-phosphate isomerase
VNINAYHQPGVEAGKKAAGRLLQLQAALSGILNKNPGKAFTAGQLAQQVQADPEDAFHLLNHLAANYPQYTRHLGDHPAEDTFAYSG